MINLRRYGFLNILIYEKDVWNLTGTITDHNHASVNLEDSSTQTVYTTETGDYNIDILLIL